MLKLKKEKECIKKLEKGFIFSELLVGVAIFFMFCANTYSFGRVTNFFSRNSTNNNNSTIMRQAQIVIDQIEKYENAPEREGSLLFRKYPKEEERQKLEIERKKLNDILKSSSGVNIARDDKTMENNKSIINTLHSRMHLLNLQVMLEEDKGLDFYTEYYLNYSIVLEQVIDVHKDSIKEIDLIRKNLSNVIRGLKNKISEGQNVIRRRDTPEKEKEHIRNINENSENIISKLEIALKVLNEQKIWTTNSMNELIRFTRTIEHTKNSLVLMSQASSLIQDAKPNITRLESLEMPALIQVDIDLNQFKI